MIKYVKNAEIDQAKWDLCLEQSLNGLVYGYSWYLNKVSPEWDALILDDYVAVFPLTRGRKYFISYLYQPFFTQQLGVFAKIPLTQELLVQFLEAIPKKFRFIDIHLNEQNQILDLDLKVKKRRNFVLDLDKSYEKIKKGYDSQATRNLKKSQKAGLELKTISIHDVVKFYMLHKAAATKGVKEADYEQLLTLMEVALEKRKILGKGVYAKSGELLAAGAFLAHKNRIIFLIGNGSEMGREFGAMTFLMDALIFQFSGHKMLFDFEGSEIEGIARFFKSFGSEKRNYYRFKRNSLPWLIRLIKN